MVLYNFNERAYFNKWLRISPLSSLHEYRWYKCLRNWEAQFTRSPCGLDQLITGILLTFGPNPPESKWLLWIRPLLLFARPVFFFFSDRWVFFLDFLFGNPWSSGGPGLAPLMVMMGLCICRRRDLELFFGRYLNKWGNKFLEAMGIRDLPSNADCVAKIQRRFLQLHHHEWIQKILQLLKLSPDWTETFRTI